MLTGQNGILTQAQNASYKTQEAEAEEKENLEKQNELIEDIVNGETKEGIEVGEKAQENTTIDGNKGAYNNPTIPKGFKAIDTDNAKWKESNGWENGLVIEDATSDPVTSGSQFVWVPVQNFNDFHLIEGYYEENLQKYLSSIDNPSKEAGSNSTEPYTPGKPNQGNTIKGTQESIAMYASVKEYGGFYIARYEAGINGTEQSTITNDENKQIQNGSVKPVSKPRVGVWNLISFGGTKKDISPNDGLSGDDTKDGAVKVARSMYNNVYTGNNNLETTVKSTLCYGVQWDAVMNFIDNRFVNGMADEFLKNSSGRGNYSGKIAVTGDKPEYMVKNIYDLAGNVEEWTMEGASQNNMRITRGGEYSSSGSVIPVSFRNSFSPETSRDKQRFQSSSLFIIIY